MDGRIACAAIEERHSRVRYAGGFAAAAPAVLTAGGLEIEGVDAIGLSTCCDSPWAEEEDRLAGIIEELCPRFADDRLRRTWSGRVHLVDHHDSHAMLGFVGSGYRRALVCVMDGFGNRLDDTGRFHTSDDWWRGGFERQTMFLAEWREGRVHLERVHQGATRPEEIGLAELYRTVTHYLGWHSYQYSGKTMALASYGERSRFQRLRLAELDEQGAVRVLLPNRHDDPYATVADALRTAGYVVPPTLRRPASPEEPFLADVAATLQDQFERTLIESVEQFADRHQVSCVAFAGGAALNCIALGKLARARPDLELYVPPAPGDTGQGLGNALWLAYAEASPVREGANPPSIRAAALGPVPTAAAVAAAADRFIAARRGLKLTRPSRTAGLAEAAAALVANGKTVALRVGGLEYGPRALGHCSILADPRDPEAQWKVNQVKHRESFRPFATSVLERHLQACFPGAGPSPFMSFAARAGHAVRSAAPGIVHVDGTTRYQSVAADQGLFGAILTEFQRLTRLPLILNTSLNIAGEPMAESPTDALDVFERGNLDAIVLGDLLITRE